MEKKTYRKCQCPFCQTGRVKKVHRNGVWWGRCTNPECQDSLVCCRLLSRKKDNGIFLWESHHISQLAADVQTVLLAMSRKGEAPVYVGKYL